MFCLSDSDRFFLYPYPTDMRKSFYSLSGIVTEKMGKDVQEGDAFIFINKSLTNMKILHAEYGGLVIYNMRLESGTFRLSDIDCEDSSASLSINWSELTLIVHGISPSETKRAPRWSPKKECSYSKIMFKSFCMSGVFRTFTVNIRYGIWQLIPILT